MIHSSGTTTQIYSDDIFKRHQIAKMEMNIYFFAKRIFKNIDLKVLLAFTHTHTHTHTHTQNLVKENSADCRIDILPTLSDGKVKIVAWRACAIPYASLDLINHNIDPVLPRSDSFLQRSTHHGKVV